MRCAPAALLPGVSATCASKRRVRKRLLHHAFAQVRRWFRPLRARAFRPAAVRKNGRRNGQCMRSPKVSRSARIRAFSSARKCRRQLHIRPQQPVPKLRSRRRSRLRMRMQGPHRSCSLRSRRFFPRRADKSRRPRPNSQHFFPARPGICGVATQRAINHQPCHAIHYMRRNKNP